MKRKGLFGLLIFVPLLLTSCDGFGHTHTWSPFMDNGDGTHYRMCYKDSRHIETSEHNYVEEVITEATDTTPGKILKKCIDCGCEEEVRINPTGHHVYDQEVVAEKYLAEKTSDYSGIYYKSSVDGAYGDDTKLFEKTLLPEGYSNIEYLQGSGTEFVDTGIERTENTTVSYNNCKRGNGRLPYDYQEVEYIEFTGSQWIDTGINGDATWDFSLQWTQTQERQLMGYGGTGGEYFGVNKGYYAIYQVSETPIGNKDEVKFMYEGMNSAVYVNGIQAVGGGYEAGASNKTFAVGSLHGKAFCQFKLYSLVVTKSENKVAEFVPCYNIDTTEIGLYDLITCEFFGNSGTGTFLKGNDINPGSRLPSEYQEVEYLEATGTQFIDTGYKYSTKDELEISLIPLDENLQLGGGQYTTEQGEMYIGYRKWIAHKNGHLVANNDGYLWETSDLGSQQDILYSNKAVYVNDVLKTNITEDYTTAYNLTLFCLNRGGSYIQPSSCRIKKFGVRKNGFAILNLIPCYIKLTNEAGMYDLVTNSFFGNLGTGEFIVGRNVEPQYRLPYQYQEVEYLEATGTQYIDTGISAVGGIVTEFGAEWTLAGSYLVGSHGELPNYNRNGACIHQDGTWEFGYGDTCEHIGKGELNNYYDVEFSSLFDNAYLVINNEVIHTTSGQQLTTDLNIWLFGNQYAKNNFDSCCPGILYYVKLYKNEVLLRDFVPCYKKATNEAGMYDLVTNSFFGNSGTDEFEVGPNVSIPSVLPFNYAKLEYIEGSGTQFIDTGCTINKDDNAILTLDFSANNNDNVWCGANWYLQFSSSYLSDLNRHKIIIENVNGFETIKSDGSLLTTNDFTSEDKKDIKIGLFKLGNDNNSWHTVYPPLCGKLYGATLEIDNIIIFDFVPCINLDTLEVGLYDVVSRKFFKNDGTGSFNYENKLKTTRLEQTKENIKIGYRYSKDESSYYYGRIYDATIYNGNQTVQKLIPALRNSDSTIGMYDLIGNKFYPQTGNFKNSGVVGHHLDKGVVTKEATLDEEGDITYTCSICGAKIHQIIPRLAYKVNFSYDEGVEEIRVHFDDNPSNYNVTNVAYTRNPFSFNYSSTNAAVWFEVICKDGYELDKVNVPFLSCMHTSKDGIEYLLLIQGDLEVNITSKLSSSE